MVKTRRSKPMASWLATVGGLAAWFVSLSVAAHHSFAMYDRQKITTLTGKLTRYIPGANHAQIYFELLDANGKVVMATDGKPVVWGVEAGPAAQLGKRGITSATFPPGTVLTVNVYPLRDGRTFGVVAAERRFIVKCGNQLPSGGCTPESGEVFDEIDN